MYSSTVRIVRFIHINLVMNWERARLVQSVHTYSKRVLDTEPATRSLGRRGAFFLDVYVCTYIHRYTLYCAVLYAARAATLPSFCPSPCRCPLCGRCSQRRLSSSDAALTRRLGGGRPQAAVVGLARGQFLRAGAPPPSASAYMRQLIRQLTLPPIHPDCRCTAGAGRGRVPSVRPLAGVYPLCAPGRVRLVPPAFPPRTPSCILFFDGFSSLFPSLGLPALPPLPPPAALPLLAAAMPLLHGTLDIHIRSGRSIWDPSTRSARQRLAARLSGPAPPCPYVTVSVGPRRLVKTATVDDGVAPVWNTTAQAPVADEVTELDFRVKGAGSSGGVLGVVGGGAALALGRAAIPVARLMAEGCVSGELALGGKRDAVFGAGGGGSHKVRGWITVSVTYTPCSYATEEDGRRSMAVPRCFFPLRSGPSAGVVRLYQDAHVHAGTLPPVVNGHGVPVVTGRTAWVDLWAALDAARVVIYIAGWAVDANLRLVREAPSSGVGLPDETLGELLKRKAAAGVRVAIMVWNELASVAGVSDGLMGTGDEALVAYFRGSQVAAVGVSRRDDGTSGVLGGLAVGGLWTHVRGAERAITRAGGRKWSVWKGCWGRWRESETSCFERAGVRLCSALCAPRWLLYRVGVMGWRDGLSADGLSPVVALSLRFPACCRLAVHFGLSWPYLLSSRQHQKTVVVDSPPPPRHPPGTPHLTAFLGGLDLTTGRWDSPQHSLFRTKTTYHAADFHQACLLGASPAYSPREPWHDIHASVSGAPAVDVMANFCARWATQVPKQPGAVLPMSQFDIVGSCGGGIGGSDGGSSGGGRPGMDAWGRCSSGAVVGPAGVADGWPPSMAGHGAGVSGGGFAVAPSRGEEWAVQILRSIDGRSTGFGDTDAVASREGGEVLTLKKGRFVDQSIYKGYIWAIRGARRFVYIENQYFMGSSHAWRPHPSGAVDQLVPMELALKIAHKVRARESFSAYVVIPLQPEGTQAAAVEEILFWQGQTVRMMYARIGAVLDEVYGPVRAGQTDRPLPTDYLQFFALLNRESTDHDPVGPVPAPPGSASEAPARYRRGAIYVRCFCSGSLALLLLMCRCGVLCHPAALLMFGRPCSACAAAPAIE